MKPRVAILYTDGINREHETAYAFSQAGGEPEVVHLNDLMNTKKTLDDFQIAVFPGGFAYGDDIVSGKIMANDFLYKLRDQIETFLNRDTLTIGICNGFQVLVRMGVLPFSNLGAIDAALMNNDVGHLESRWLKLKIQESDCIFTKGLEGRVIEIPASNGEGKFIAEPGVLDKLDSTNQIVFKYVDDSGNETMEFPANPSGSLRAIAGICNEKGTVMGLMPHPECYTRLVQHPAWQTHDSQKEPDCLPIFQNAVNYFM